MSKKIDIYKSRKKKLNINNPKKVSVIIPNYNYEKYIIERIDSILFQTYPIYELIILDDCSKDNSVEVVKQLMKKDPRINLYQNKETKGTLYSKSLGVKYSKGKFK